VLIASLNQCRDHRWSRKTKAVLSEWEKPYSITECGFCLAIHCFARIGDDKNITGFMAPRRERISMEEEHKLGIHVLQHSSSSFFFNETSCQLAVLSEEKWFQKSPLDTLNVGHQLAAACLDTGVGDY
jgi:hypothetical protein